MKVGDVVIAMDQRTPRGLWPLSRVIEVHPAPDGSVSVVDVKMKQKVYRRSINVLIPVEIEQ